MFSGCDLNSSAAGKDHVSPSESVSPALKNKSRAHGRKLPEVPTGFWEVFGNQECACQLHHQLVESGVLSACYDG